MTTEEKAKAWDALSESIRILNVVYQPGDERRNISECVRALMAETEEVVCSR